MTKAGIRRKLKHARARKQKASEAKSPPSKLRNASRTKSRRVGRKQVAGGSYFVVSDAAALATAIQEEVDHTFAGKVNQAARQVGMSQSTLSRLVRMKSDRITSDTATRLGKLLARDRAAWGTAIITKAAQASLVAYRVWLSAFKVRAAEKAPPGADAILGAWIRRPTETTLQFLALLERARSLDPQIFATLDDLHAMGQFFSSRLAMIPARVLEPLLEFFETGGIERHPNELTDDELRRFVRAGIDRELILLNRAADAERAEGAQALAARVQLVPHSDNVHRDLRPRGGIAEAIGDDLQRHALATFKAVPSSIGSRARSNKSY